MDFNQYEDLQHILFTSFKSDKVKIKTFGQTVKSHRLAQNLLQKQLATTVGVSQGWLAMLESGRAVPGAVRLRAIMTALHMSVSPWMNEASNNKTVPTTTLSQIINTPQTNTSLNDYVNLFIPLWSSRFQIQKYRIPTKIFSEALPQEWQELFIMWIQFSANPTYQTAIALMNLIPSIHNAWYTAFVDFLNAVPEDLESKIFTSFAALSTDKIAQIIAILTSPSTPSNSS